jgi:hypothetical protein
MASVLIFDSASRATSKSWPHGRDPAGLTLPSCRHRHESCWAATSCCGGVPRHEQAGTEELTKPMESVRPSVDRVDLTPEEGRIRLAAGPVGLRQDHDLADDRGLHANRPAARSRMDGKQSSSASARRAAGASRHVDDLPELCHLAEHDGGRECRLRPAGAEAVARGDEGPGRQDPGRRPARNLGPLPGRTVGRPAAARRAGPRHRGRARSAAARRTAVQPRRQPARGDALRDPPPARRIQASPRSTSPTTSPRRWRPPTGSRS